MPADVTLAVSGVESTPLDYPVPGAAELVLKMLSASYDGTLAAGAFVPAVQLLVGGTIVAGTFALGSTIAAGASADVTWFPGVARGAGIPPPQPLVGARIEATSTQAIADSTGTNLVYQTVAFDTDGMANLAADNRILTVNTAGTYLVLVCTQWVPNGAGRRINAALQNQYFAGSPFPPVGQTQADNRNAVWTPISASLGRTSNTSVGLYQAAVGDFFSSGAYQASGSTINANGFVNCFLAATLIGV